ncbi:MAG: glycosyl hydrolase family 8 [Patescibacteria group bacterium]
MYKKFIQNVCKVLLVSLFLTVANVVFASHEMAAIGVGRELIEKSVIEGYPDGSLKLDQTINRAEAAKIIALYYFPERKYFREACYSDVPAERWFSPYICVVNFIDGYADGSFRPGDRVNYGEALKMMYVAAFGSYPRAEVGEAWFDGVLRQARAEHVLRSAHNGNEYVTRGEFASLVARTGSARDGALASFNRGLLFFEKNMTGAEGRIAQFGSDFATTSESVGLLLMTAAYAGDHDIFEKEYVFLKKHLLSEYGLAYWQLLTDLTPTSPSNSTPDDLNIIEGLLAGFDRFGDERYRDTALEMGAALRRYAVRDGVPTSLSSWNESGVYTASDLLLFYAQLDAIHMLSAYDSSWSEIEENTRDVLEGGFKNGFFAKQFTIHGGEYVYRFEHAIIEQLLTALYLRSGPILDFIKNEMRTNGRIFGSYTLDGLPASDVEDMAVYGLAGRLALVLEDYEFAHDVAAKIMSTQILQSTAKNYGAFSWSPDADVYSFSQLQTLLFLALATD